MMYENSSNIIYQFTADRLKRRKEVLKLTNDVIARKKVFVHYESYEDWITGEDEPERFIAEINLKNSKKFDSSMISRILNNERGKLGKRNSPNPYLIPPMYEDVLVEQLQFRDKNELFWGATEELEFIVKAFYTELFKEILKDSQSELSRLLNLYLIDYIPYSKERAYYQIIKEKCMEQCDYFSKQLALQGIIQSKEELWDIFINMVENDLQQVHILLDQGDWFVNKMCFTIVSILYMLGERRNAQIDSMLLKFSLLMRSYLDITEAIGRFIILNFKDLLRLYQQYFLRLDNFKSLNKKILTFVSDVLSPFFRDLVGNPDEYQIYSLGHRVRVIIETDIEKTISYVNRKILELFNDDNSFDKRIDQLLLSSKLFYILDFIDGLVLEEDESRIHFQRLLQTNLTYIDELETLQRFSDNEVAKIPSKVVVSFYYSQVTFIAMQHNEWLEQYNEYLSNNNFLIYGNYIEAKEYEELLEESEYCAE
ncbi:hypothetical protein JDW15_05315 [Aerococcaceae bacterium zg-ZJ1578]|uniref:hypothetical protein n=1 Tax=Aerococcaceae bacterium zg-252 TaxID=2796928 RepID=UPI001A1DA9AF|nr:hypothetical protein [Aerococcaceae bacterium zg-1578]